MKLPKNQEEYREALEQMLKDRAAKTDKAKERLMVHIKMCDGAKKALQGCFANVGFDIEEAKKSGKKVPFPSQCSDMVVDLYECRMIKRENAMKVAEKLAGKEACEKVFPYYNDSKNKIADLIQVYKDSGKLNKDAPFWDPSVN